MAEVILAFIFEDCTAVKAISKETVSMEEVHGAPQAQWLGRIRHPCQGEGRDGAGEFVKFVHEVGLVGRNDEH